MTVPYANSVDVKNLGGISHDDVDKFEAKYPGRLEAMSLAVSARFDSELAMRHGVPFPSPFPVELVAYVVAVLVWEMVLAKGINPNAEQIKELKAKHDKAWEWVNRVRKNEIRIVGVDATPSIKEGGPSARVMRSAKDILYGSGSRGRCGRC